MVQSKKEENILGLIPDSFSAWAETQWDQWVHKVNVCSIDAEAQNKETAQLEQGNASCCFPLRPPVHMCSDQSPDAGRERWLGVNPQILKKKIIQNMERNKTSPCFYFLIAEWVSLSESFLIISNICLHCLSFVFFSEVNGWNSVNSWFGWMESVTGAYTHRPQITSTPFCCLINQVFGYTLVRMMVPDIFKHTYYVWSHFILEWKRLP